MKTGLKVTGRSKSTSVKWSKQPKTRMFWNSKELGTYIKQK